ncbi:MAG: DUF4293 family protein [Bacteroidia bacterium]|nr:DUF4293 family protein [Bacteroidia bacterium]
MIQRIQSVFLVIIIIIIVTLCGINILHLVYVQPERQTTEYLLNLFYFNIKLNGVLTESHLQLSLISIAAVVIALSFYILINFKNRTKQMLFTQLNCIAVLALMVTFGIKAYLFVPAFSSEKMLMASVLGIALFIFCFYLIIRVYFLIKKDDDLVKSADRIR